MAICFRNYTGQPGITEDYYEVRKFFLKLGHVDFSYARWDWMTTHGYLDKGSVGKIGIWEEEGEIVGVATFDTVPGYAYCMAFPEYAFLKKEMLAYAGRNLQKDGKLGVVISDQDGYFQNIAAGLGYIATGEKENNAVFYPGETSMEYALPEGFRMTDLRETYDLARYRRVLWKGFNHELNGEGPFEYSADTEKSAKTEMERPNLDLSLKVAVAAPDGDFVAYCGMWYDPEGRCAVIEPVATDPAYRRRGLGKAAVLEGIRRVGLLGAKIVYVGSSQQFYYSIGMRPFSTASVWRLE